VIFVDSSALLKRYIQEPGSDLVDRVMREDSHWAASVLARTESEITLCRRLSGTGLHVDRVRRLGDEWHYITAVPVDADCLLRARAIGCDFSIRTLDAIHLAAAQLIPGRPAFLTFDMRQRDTAVKLGLPVIVAGGDAR
jgi:predicted nucleic acid-binding protein